MLVSYWDMNKKFATTKYDLSHPLTVVKMINLMKYRQFFFFKFILSLSCAFKKYSKLKVAFHHEICSIDCWHHIYPNYPEIISTQNVGKRKWYQSYLVSSKSQQKPEFLIVPWIERRHCAGYTRSSGKEGERIISYHSQMSNL